MISNTVICKNKTFPYSFHPVISKIVNLPSFYVVSNNKLFMKTKLNLESLHTIIVFHQP